MAETFDPYHLWLGIPPKEQPANHYRLLGINLFESDPEVIDNAADRQMVHLRSFQLGKQAELSQRLLNEMAAAKVCLLRPEKKAAYDQQLRQQLQTQAEAAESARPEIDSQLALALERQSRKGRSHLQSRPTLGRGAILSTAVAVAALLVIIAVWAAATRKAPLRTAGRRTLPWLSGRPSGWAGRRRPSAPGIAPEYCPNAERATWRRPRALEMDPPRTTRTWAVGRALP